MFQYPVDEKPMRSQQTRGVRQLPCVGSLGFRESKIGLWWHWWSFKHNLLTSCCVSTSLWSRGSTCERVYFLGCQTCKLKYHCHPIYIPFQRFVIWLIEPCILICWRKRVTTLRKVWILRTHLHMLNILLLKYNNLSPTSHTNKFPYMTLKSSLVLEIRGGHFHTLKLPLLPRTILAIDSHSWISFYKAQSIIHMDEGPHLCHITMFVNLRLSLVSN